MISWNEFRSLHKGKGHSMSQLAIMYKNQSTTKHIPRCTESICYIDKAQDSHKDSIDLEILTGGIALHRTSKTLDTRKLPPKLDIQLTKWISKNKNKTIIYGELNTGCMGGGKSYKIIKYQGKELLCRNRRDFALFDELEMF